MVIHFQAGVYLKLYVLDRLHSEHHGGAGDPNASFPKMPGPGACSARHVEKNGDAPADIMLPLCLCASIQGSLHGEKYGGTRCSENDPGQRSQVR
jgi:hypothetical protein